MRCCLLSLLGGTFLLSLSSLPHSAKARVHTEIQTGPLYRVLNAPLSIFCNVSGFADTDSQKHFEFGVTKPSKPTFPFNIISTREKDFGYSRYLQRALDGEITLRHLSPNSVLFEIHRLQKDDEGDYDCVVINPVAKYDGKYNAKTTVKVIDDSLSVSSPLPPSLSYTEGDALTLTCQASSNTLQHTHLSVAWYLHKDGEENSRPVISLDRDFTLSAGREFERRYHTGIVRLDKIGEATYRLTMAQLQLSDKGRIYCAAQEWIQDPDGSWYIIAQKDAEKTTVDIKAKEVIRDTSSLVVRISAHQTALQEGQEMSLSCHVDTQNLEKRFFSVAWLRDSVELASIGPTGVLSVGPGYSGREKEGELRAARIEDRHYRLILQPVRTEDQGQYLCQAWPEDRGQDGAFTKGAGHSSIAQLVSISATESGLSVAMQPQMRIKEGERLKLTCKVDGVKGQLSVSWNHQPTSTSTAFKDIINLSQDGVTETATEFVSRKVRAMHPAADTFTLELDDVTPSDSGVYHCTVSEWKTNSKILSRSENTTVSVAPIESFVRLRLINRKTAVTVGENVELMCRVQGPHVPITLIWSLQREASTVDNILTLYSDGRISWSGDDQVYQVKVAHTSNEVIHYLLINGVSHREAGNYQCRASVFIDNVHKKLPPSNLVAVMVQNPESQLVLTSLRNLTKNINSDVELNCSVSSGAFASSRFAVTWLHQHVAENRTILSSDRDALITFGTQRVSMRRTKGPSFELTIRQAQISDGGSYICEVVEWLQDPRGNWYQLLPVSQITQLKLTEPANDLRLQVSERWLTATEGDDVELKCDIISDAFTPSFFYKVAWLYSGRRPFISNVPVVALDHTGLLTYPENQAVRGLQGRLRLLRATPSSFTLRIRRAHEEDSGSYSCQVDQYQLDHEGQWQQKASDTAGPIGVAVNATENSLSVATEEAAQNVSTSQEFHVPCHVTNQSSVESEFQVTWFWQDTQTSQQLPIFTVYRNATLQTKFGKGEQLRFDHPLPNHFSLTVMKPRLGNSGLYSCKVEEWLPSPSRVWRKVAAATSGYMTVSVFTEGEPSSEPQCQSSTWIGILLPIVICSLLVILVLVLKICRTKAALGGKKTGQSLWAEEHPLNTKPSAVD